MNLKNYIENKITSLKCWIKEYFLLENSLEHLENFIKNFYVSSIGFNDIYYGNKNMKTFIICIVNWTFGWFAVGFFLSFVFSDKMFALIDVPSISDQNLKLIVILATIMLFQTALIRTDYLFGQINYNLNSFKVIYYLMKDLKQLHKLNEKNYKKLAILSRSIQILFMDCGAILLAIAITLFMIKIAILSWKISWIWCIIINIFIYITNATSSISIICLYIILLAYYTFIFDQINDEINLISSKKTFSKRKKLIINKTKQRQLINLIDQHNLAAIEIHKFNLMVRRSVGFIFVTLAIIKIVSFYLMLNLNEFFIKLYLIILNFFILSIGFGYSFLFTRQIKSAHQPLKTLRSIVCKYRMNLKLKLKAS